MLMEQLHKTMLLHKTESNSHKDMIMSMKQVCDSLKCPFISYIITPKYPTMDLVIKSSNALVEYFFKCKLNNQGLYV